MLIRTQDAINKQILNSTVHIPEEGTGAEGQDKFPLRNQYCILWPSKNSGCQNEWLAKKANSRRIKHIDFIVKYFHCIAEQMK